MSYTERLIYCTKVQDTKKLLEMMKSREVCGNQSDCCAVATLTLKQNWLARYRNEYGTKLGNQIIVDTYSNTIELKNKDLFTRKSQIGMVVTKEMIENSSRIWTQEKEHFFNKNDVLIYMCGESSTSITGKNIFGFDFQATKRIVELAKINKIAKNFIIDGKINIEEMQPLLGDHLLENESDFTEDEIRIIKDVKAMDVLGIKDYDKYFSDPALFKAKEI